MVKTPHSLRTTDLLMPFLVVFVFVLMQLVCYWATRNIILSSLLSGVLSVLLLTRPLGPIRQRQAFRPTRLPVSAAALALGAGVLNIAATALLGELTRLPDASSLTFSGLLGFPLTWITVGVAGPVCEELLFREGIQGGLTRKGMNPVWAIMMGTLLFSAAHNNPAQSLAAVTSGIVLGALYHRTQNVLLCGLVHIINNLAGLLQLSLSKSVDMGTPLLDLLGSRPAAWVLMVVLYGCVAAMLWRLFSRQEEK